MSFQNGPQKITRLLAYVLVGVTATIMGLAGPASAETTGAQRFVITFSGPLSEALTTGRPVVASGVVTGRGHEQFISEGPGPTPGSFVAETSFVFPEGVLFLSVRGTTVTSRDFGPGDCFHLDVSRGSYEITGGTGALAGASGSGTVTARNITRRAVADSGCSEDDPSLISSIHARGTLTLPSEAVA
ncbi:MAG: hypothetical protein M3179_13545 [Actinomycetota bacterium]|nr:hypothetical protein [Actinomycetota bacterium]